MAKYTSNYDLGYFSRGGAYSGEIDYRRFVTLDYNLDSYVGIVGAGIINGWNIEPVTGTTISITPGTGMINGFYSESEYVLKQRAAITGSGIPGMASGDWEVEVVNDTGITQPNLTP